jgi:hypothetical protein
MSIDFVAYHDRSGDDHQLQFNRLYNAGYRMISLSVYNPDSPLYAAVWVKRTGPPWAAIHGASADTWQIFFNQWAAQGFHPIILTACGPMNNAIFAAVVEQRPGPIPLTRHHLISGADTDQNSIQYWNKQAHANGWNLAWAASYGDAVQARFAGFGHPMLGELFGTQMALAIVQMTTSGASTLKCLTGPDLPLSPYRERSAISLSSQTIRLANGWLGTT